MHEVGVARNVIKAAMAAVPGGGVLGGVTVTIGPLSPVVAGSLRSGVGVASRETPAEGVDLDIVAVPLVGHCSECGRDPEIRGPERLQCPICSSPVDIVSSHETTVTAIRYDER